jgi:hypothetical protein
MSVKKLLWYLSAVGLALVAVLLIYGFFYITGVWFGYQGSIFDMFNHSVLLSKDDMLFFFAKLLSWGGGVMISLFYAIWLLDPKRKKS